MSNPMPKFQVYRDGEPISEVFDQNMDAFGWLLRHQGRSVDHATKYEGYAIVELES